MTPIRITHFSDVLCIWAYVGQIRIDELLSEFERQVEIEYRLFPVFGSARRKIMDAWGEEHGARAYCQHIQKIAADFNHVSVHAEIWHKVMPHSSLPGHLYLCAIRLLEQNKSLPAGTFAQMSWTIRKAFFAELRDVSDVSVLDDLVEQADLPGNRIKECIESGQAYAELADDMKLARDHMIKASPTLIFNEDRQRLTGNVGYKIIEANIRELIHKPVGQQSWC